MKIWIALLAALVVALPAAADQQYTTPSGAAGDGSVLLYLNGSNKPVPAIISGTPTQASISCGTSSTTLLAANSATSFVRVVVPNAAANSVWFNWSGATATAAAPSEELKPGQSMVWSPINGFVPTSAITCIASASTSVTVIYK